MTKIVIFVLAFILPALAAANVYGPDQRTAVTSRDYPWSTVGRLSNGCTGTLVGRDVVLTASHCLATNGALRRDATSFTVDGSTAAIVDFTLGTTRSTKESWSDWAVVRISEPLGDRAGYMDIDSELTKSGLTAAGFSTDFQGGTVASAHVGCSIRQFNQLLALGLHDCHVTSGASGAPLFFMRSGRAIVTAVHISHRQTAVYFSSWSPSNTNYAVPAAAFMRAVNAGRNGIASTPPPPRTKRPQVFQRNPVTGQLEDVTDKVYPLRN